MSVFINGGTAGDLNPGFDGAVAPVATATAIVRQTALQVSIGGTVITDALSAQVSYGWDQISGQARIVCSGFHGSKGDQVVVTMGAGNNVQRFKGVLLEWDTTLAPHAVGHVAKGPLYLLEEFKHNIAAVAADEGKPGLDFETLVGASTATLQQIVAAVLTTAGISYSLSNFDNPTEVYGTLAPENFTWGTRETAAAYLNRILGASAGYRLFDSSDGQIYLRQVSGVPSSSPDFTLTLGQDILGNSTALHSSLGEKTSVMVEGYDDGSGPATSGLVGSGSDPFRVTSDLIETDAWATTLAGFWLPIVARPQQVVRISTHRDDLFGPGQTHLVDAAGGLGVVQNLWVKSYVAEMATNGQFTQSTVCVAA